jgi:hypothetical protein
MIACCPSAVSTCALNFLHLFRIIAQAHCRSKRAARHVHNPESSSQLGGLRWAAVFISKPLKKLSNTSGFLHLRSGGSRFHEQVSHRVQQVFLFGLLYLIGNRNQRLAHILSSLPGSLVFKHLSATFQRKGGKRSSRSGAVGCSSPASTSRTFRIFQSAGTRRPSGRSISSSSSSHPW